jgi:histone H3/H4
MQAYLAAGGKLPEINTSGAKNSDTLVFPVARIRKICKLDPDVRGISKEAAVLITKAAEQFCAGLGKETVSVAALQNRRKLLPDDVAQVCSSRDQYLFLRDDVRDLVATTTRATTKTTTVAKADKLVHQGATLTSFGFSAKAKK